MGCSSLDFGPVANGGLFCGPIAIAPQASEHSDHAWRLLIRCGAPKKPTKAGRQYHEEIGLYDIFCRCLGGL
jgi:hypothetical protein